MHYDGWVLRFNGGYTRRANSVNLIGPSSLPIEVKIQYCEDAYRAARQYTVFKLFTDPEAENLDRKLALLGYKTEGHTDVMIRPLSRLDLDRAMDIRVETELTDRWLNAAAELNEIDTRHRSRLEHILRNIRPHHGFASVRIGGETVSVGLSVVERGWLGIFDIVTAKSHRRQGFGRSLVNNMMEWGHQHGAANAYLQVMTNNISAINLYRSLGFVSEYSYWYRTQ